MTLFSCATRVTYVRHARRFEIEAIRPPQASILIYSISVVAQNSRRNMRKKIYLFIYIKWILQSFIQFSLLSFPNDSLRGEREREKLLIIISSRRNDRPGRMNGVGG